MNIHKIFLGVFLIASSSVFVVQSTDQSSIQDSYVIKFIVAHDDDYNIIAAWDKLTSEMRELVEYLKNERDPSVENATQDMRHMIKMMRFIQSLIGENDALHVKMSVLNNKENIISDNEGKKGFAIDITFNISDKTALAGREKVALLLSDFSLICSSDTQLAINKLDDLVQAIYSQHDIHGDIKVVVSVFN